MSGEAPADAVERLYGLPLEQFTAARNALAKRLRAEGEREAAAAVQALSKPPLAIWALNQAARECRDDVRVLLRAAERLREDPDAAGRDLRAALDGLVRRARAALEEAGRSAPANALQTVATAARTAALAAPDELRRGVLGREPDPVGFEALAPFMAAAPPPARAPARRDAAGEARRRARETRAARDAVAQARTRARELRNEAEEAERAAERARAAADGADEELARAEEELRRLADSG